MTPPITYPITGGLRATRPQNPTWNEKWKKNLRLTKIPELSLPRAYSP